MAPKNAITHLGDMACAIVDRGRVQLLDCIGAGSFGAVYRARDLVGRTSDLMAVKVMTRQDPLWRICCRELQYLQRVQGHPRIARMHRWWKDDDFVYLALDYYPGGDMWHAIHEKRLFWRRGDLLKRVFVQLVDAVAWCHKRGVFHRDLKPGNVLISADGQDIWLTDFGLASSKEISGSYHVGTQQYRSPECSNIWGADRPYSLRRNDIWALGVILVNMLTGAVPWAHATEGNDYYQSYLCSTEFLRYTLPISKEASYICQRIFTENEDDTIDLVELRELALGVEEWWMSEEEIAESDEHLKRVANGYRRVDPRPSTSYASNFSSVSNDESNSLADDSDDSNEHSNGIRSASLLAVEEGRMERKTEESMVVTVPLDTPPRSTSSLSAAVTSQTRVEPVVVDAAKPKAFALGSRDAKSSSSYYSTQDSSYAVSGVSSPRDGVKKLSMRSSGLGVRRHVKRIFSTAAV